MPYTQEELKNLSWYQNLIDEDEQAYLANKDILGLDVSTISTELLVA